MKQNQDNKLVTLFEIIRKIPFIRLLIPFALGIIIQDFLGIEQTWIIWLVLSSFIVFVGLILIRKINESYNLSWIIGLVLYFFLFFAGIQVTIQKSELFNNLENIIQADYIFGDILEYPEDHSKNIKLLVDINLIKKENVWSNESGKAIVYVEKDSLSEKLEVGDRIVFKNLLFEIENNKNPYEFDYKQYLKYHFVNRQGFLKQNDWQPVSGKSSNSIKILAQKIRKKLLDIYKANGIKDDVFSIAAALTLGYKNDMNPDLQQAYSSAGAMHVLAVSGLHVGIIYLIVDYLFIFFRKSKKVRFIKPVIIIAVLWIYALLTGLSPSVIRAALMFSLITAGQSFKRQMNIYNIIAVSAFLILLYNPYMIFEVGFQLSYMAVLAIVFFQPPLYRLLYFKYKFFDKLWALLTVSIAAQIGTAPISMYYFHQFPNYFFISNFIVIPMATMILISGIILLATSFIPAISSVMGFILNFLVTFLNHAVIFIKDLPYSTIKGINITGFELIILYVMIILISLFFILKNRRYLFGFLSVFCIFLLFNIYKTYYYSERKLMVVYNIYKTSTLNLITQRSSFLFTDSQDSTNTNRIKYSAENNWLREGVKENYFVCMDSLDAINNQSIKFRMLKNSIYLRNRYIHFSGVDILWIDHPITFLSGESIHKVKLDFVILNRNAKVSVRELANHFEMKMIILSSSNFESSVLLWEDECKEEGISYYDVRSHGAFINKMKYN